QHVMFCKQQARAGTAPSAPFVDLDRTMMIKGADPAPDEPILTAKILVVAGKTDRSEYPLTKQVNLIGSREGAVIRLTGWFAPKSAATIARRGTSYSISPSRDAKYLLVNGADVAGQQELKDGDQIEVAGVKLTFCILSGAK